MKLGTRARYSLRMMIEIAGQSDASCPINLQDVASLTGISRRYLEQLAIPLRRARLLEGRAGRNGGQYLPCDPGEIRLGEVLEAASGRVVLADCVDDPGVCPRSATCQCHLLWTLLTLRIRKVLNDYTLADTSDPGWLRAEVDKERRAAAGFEKANANANGRRRRRAPKEGR